MDNNLNELGGTVQELIINITDRIDDISNRYRESNVFDEERTINLLDDIKALTEGLTFLEAYRSSINLFELQDKLQRMDEALESKDYALFNDLLQYELKDLFIYWKEIISK